MNAQHRPRHPVRRSAQRPADSASARQQPLGGHGVGVHGGVSRLARAWRGAALGRAGHGGRQLLVLKAANDNQAPWQTRLARAGAGAGILAVAAGGLLLLAL